MSEPAKRLGIAGQVFAWAFSLLGVGFCVWSMVWRLSTDHEAYNWRPPAHPVVKTITGRFVDVTLTQSHRFGYRFVTDSGETITFHCEAGGETQGLHYHGCLTSFPEELRNRPITVRYYEATVHPSRHSNDRLILGLERDGRVVFRRPVSNTY